jgi:deferrochelatase/peroxidase EfeB
MARRTFSRRDLLGHALTTGAGAAVGAVVVDGMAGLATPPAGAVEATSTGWEAAPLHGPHQAGVIEVESPAATFVAFDLTVASRSELAALMRTMTERARILTGGGSPENVGPVAPPDDNGILGPIIPPGQLEITVGLGSSVFEPDRFGLSHRRPARIKPMRTFPNDNLDPAQSHGDISVQFRAAQTDTVIHALRDLTKHTRGAMQPRWRIDGVHSPPRPAGTPRNYLGFRDGIAHPDVSSPAAASELLWVQPGAPEPAWAAGGTYQVIRIIRMLVEFWDRVSLQEQETMIGRRKASGAPLDGNTQSDIPDYKADPGGTVIPLSAHIRLANPRTKHSAPSQILRRGFNYDRGIDSNGNLDQGLVFTCYQRDIERQFEAVQTRLIDEPLVDYISPVGGGYFFVPRGLRDSSDYYASGLFA